MENSQRILALTSKALLLLVLSSPVAIVLLALQSQPTVPANRPLNPAEISQIEQLLVNNVPQNIANQSLQEFSLSNEELNLLLRYAGEIMESTPPLSGQIFLTGNTLLTELSIPLNNRIFPLYLNLSAEFTGSSNEFQLSSLKAGYIRVPGNLVNNLTAWLKRQYLSNAQSYIEITELLESVQQIEISADRLNLTLRWEPTLLGRIRTQAQHLFVSDPDQQRIARHYNVLAQVLSEIPESTRAIPLTSLFKPLFLAAQAQTRLDRNPIAENRTLLLTLAAYVNQDDVRQWLNPELQDQLSPARHIEVRVQRRQDLARHIISSAAITASAGAVLARIISSTKEAYDARYRTGFSFSDMTANIAGVAIGRLATESVVSAELLQQRMTLLISDMDFLPPVGSSRDGLSESAFNALYRDSNSSNYQARVAEIESLVYELPLFQGLRIN